MTVFPAILRRPGRRAVGLAALGLVATIAATSLAVPSASAVPTELTGTVYDDDGSVIYKAGPNSVWDTVGTVANGTHVNIICQTPGQSVSGPRGTSNIWDMISNGRFLPDTGVRTGQTAGTYVVNQCTYVGEPPRANPRTTNGAISWAFAHLGSTAYEGDCLIFARTSYGWNNGSGWSTAEVGGDYMASHNRLGQGVPPRGALVWYHNSSGTGHVAISLGEGLVISTSVNGKVGVASYTFHGQYRGWSRPWFPLAS